MNLKIPKETRFRCRGRPNLTAIKKPQVGPVSWCTSTRVTAAFRPSPGNERCLKAGQFERSLLNPADKRLAVM